MLKLTNNTPSEHGATLLVAAGHVVAMREDVNFGGTKILTVSGVEFRVSETLEEIGKMPGWGAQ